MKLFRSLARFEAGAPAHGLFALSIDARPLTGIGAFHLPGKPAPPDGRKRFLARLRAQLARRCWGRTA